MKERKTDAVHRQERRGGIVVDTGHLGKLFGSFVFFHFFFFPLRGRQKREKEGETIKNDRMKEKLQNWQVGRQVSIGGEVRFQPDQKPKVPLFLLFLLFASFLFLFPNCSTISVYLFFNGRLFSLECLRLVSIFQCRRKEGKLILRRRQILQPWIKCSRRIVNERLRQQRAGLRYAERAIRSVALSRLNARRTALVPVPLSPMRRSGQGRRKKAGRGRPVWVGGFFYFFMIFVFLSSSFLGRKMEKVYWTKQDRSRFLGPNVLLTLWPHQERMDCFHLFSSIPPTDFSSVIVVLFLFCFCFFFSIFHSLPLDVLPIGPTRKLTQTIKKNLFSFETLNLRPLFLRNCLLTQRTTRILIDERV